MRQESGETVYVVDDDPDMRETLKTFLDSIDIGAELFATAEDFLSRRDRLGERPECLILDRCLPGMDGIQLQRRLAEEQIDIPVILITAFGDIPSAVESLKLGAVTYLEKPFRRGELLDHIRTALDRKSKQLVEQRQSAAAQKRLSSLTSREQEVLDLMVAGKSTKQIASRFAIGVKAVAKHQARVLSKMGVENVVELVRLMESSDQANP